ncbi:MAG: hypothetical protein JW715_13690 [Sedimentisphaerales bacterium]|nr:hypothetical protein [Sedimentisphaerales bacterium]
MKNLYIICVILFCAAGRAYAVLDMVFVVDESYFMEDEHTWIAGMVTDMDTKLTAAGQIRNMYALVGFGAGIPDGGPESQMYSVGGTDWGTAEELAAATGKLVTSGVWEDGWEAINFSLKNYYFHSDAATHMIMVTDEDRDPIDTNLTYDRMLNSLTEKKVTLNVVVDCGFHDGTGARALGVDAKGNAYVADGSGGYIMNPGGIIVSPYCNTDTCYVELAWATGGAAWDINQLRSIELIAKSFNSAFIDYQVSDMASVPVPSAFLLAGIGIGLVRSLRKRKIL